MRLAAAWRLRTGTPARTSSAAQQPYERCATAASRTAPKRGSARGSNSVQEAAPPIGRDGELLCHAFYDLEVKVCGGASTSNQGPRAGAAVPARRPAR